MNLKTEKETLMGSKKTDLMRISYFVAIVILVCLIGNLKDLWLQSWTDLIIYLIVLFAAAECLFRFSGNFTAIPPTSFIIIVNGKTESVRKAPFSKKIF